MAISISQHAFLPEVEILAKNEIPMKN